MTTNDDSMGLFPSTSLRPKPPALPTTREGLLAGKIIKVGRDLNDEVDEAHVILWGQEDYRQLHDACWDEEAVEGSTAADNLVAAKTVRDFANSTEENQAKFPRIAKAKLATLVKALNVVTRRYGQSRTMRRRMVGGEIIGDNND